MVGPPRPTLYSSLPLRAASLCLLITASGGQTSACFGRNTSVCCPAFYLANESGETPLDIARRLRHEHCEELVSLPPARMG